jgi:error-prone DNA polymerase
LTIRGLSNEIMPLFAAAYELDHEVRLESIGPKVTLTPMTEGSEVVEDYLSKGLTLRQHPLPFLRQELKEKRYLACEDLKAVRDGRCVNIAGLVLVRQKPGSAKGVTFMTVEDETDVANIVIWSALFEKQRSLILSSGMIGCHGRVQKEGGVIHVVAEEFFDLRDMLRSVGDRDHPLRVRHGRGDEAKIGTKDRLQPGSKDVSTPVLQQTDRVSNSEIRIKGRNFH